MAGLQGSGKTTTCAKLAKLLKTGRQAPVLVAADVYRPAAIDQLQTLGRAGRRARATRPAPTSTRSTSRATASAYARAHGRDVVIVDTAGRLHVDEELMDELVDIRDAVKPHNMLLVVDAMTGQDAVNAAEAFNEQVELDGVILTKLDGDARGGAALSACAPSPASPSSSRASARSSTTSRTSTPTAWPAASSAWATCSASSRRPRSRSTRSRRRRWRRKLRRAEFTFEDFLDQLQQVRKMGSLSSILGMLPGVPGMKELKNVQVDDSQLGPHRGDDLQHDAGRSAAHPDIIDGSRRRRIAAGSGTTRPGRQQPAQAVPRDAEDAQDVLERQDEGVSPARHERVD